MEIASPRILLLATGMAQRFILKALSPISSHDNMRLGELHYPIRSPAAFQDDLNIARSVVAIPFSLS